MFNIYLKSFFLLFLIFSVFWKSHYSQLVGGLYSGKMVFWSVANRSVLKTITAHTNAIYSLKRINSSLLASAGQDATIKLWRIPSGLLLYSLIGHQDYIWSLEIFNNILLISGSSDKSIMVWNINTGQLNRTISNAHTDYVQCLKLLSNTKLASGSKDKTIKIWNPSNNFNLVTTISGYSEEVMVLGKLSNGNLLSGYKNGHVYIWSSDTYSSLGSVRPFNLFVYCLLELTDGSVGIAGDDGSIYFYNMTHTSPFEVRPKLGLAGYKKPFIGCTSDNNRIYLGDDDGEVAPITPASSASPSVSSKYDSNVNEQIYALEEFDSIENEALQTTMIPTTTTTTRTTTTTSTTTTTTTSTTTTSTIPTTFTTTITATTTSTTTATTTATSTTNGTTTTTTATPIQSTTTTTVASDFYSSTSESSNQSASSTGAFQTVSLSNGFFFTIVNERTMPYLNDNMIKHFYQQNFLTCGYECVLETSCGVFVYNIDKNCSLYQSLPTDLQDLQLSSSSTLYIKQK